MNVATTKTNRVKTALLLAAGTGSRLRPLTLDAPKCLTVVGGKPILERLIENLHAQGIQKLIVVTGYLENCIRERSGGPIRIASIHVQIISVALRKISRGWEQFIFLAVGTI